MIFRLGVTGGIGSGKSTVCKTFSVLGIPVFSADNEARKIMDTDESLKAKLTEITGEEIYVSGKLDRTKMASIIFNNAGILSKVNELVHPLVLRNFERWCNEQSSAYVIFEVAILFESGAEKHVDRVLAVVAPLEERVQRVVDRNNMSRRQVLERVDKQAGEDELVSRSDYVINNTDDRMILPEILKIHDQILLYINR